MLDFSPVKNHQISLDEVTNGMGLEDLRRLTDEMVDKMLALLANCTNEAVTFTPVDPEANDLHTSVLEEIHMPWSLGHLIVHTTATSEEAAALATELARGVSLHGRSRYEVPWRGITTVDQCCQRLEESRRMRLASLDVWPNPPHLEVKAELWVGMGSVNAIGRFVLGLMHDDAHLSQIEDVIQQARKAQGLI